MTEVTIDFSSVITLPRWLPPAGVDPALVSEWRVFREALEVHEKGHRNIGAAAVREIQRTLRMMESFSCEDLRERANREAHRIMDRYKELNKEYDRLTDHGKSQGATWPPRNRRGMVRERSG